jgi:hypothetical protein
MFSNGTTSVWNFIKIVLLEEKLSQKKKYRTWKYAISNHKPYKMKNGYQKCTK